MAKLLYYVNIEFYFTLLELNVCVLINGREFDNCMFLSLKQLLWSDKSVVNINFTGYIITVQNWFL